MTSITLPQLRKMKQDGEKFAVLTCYDASFARILDEAGVEVLLVGDSLGNVVQGRDSTIPVTVDEMVYHSAAVRRGCANALVMTDFPFLSYTSPQQAVVTAARLMQEGGAQVVKLEGGAVMVETVHHLAERGVPVCAHLGLLPQSVHKVGGYKVQGRDASQARDMLRDARMMEEAGADLLLLECVPRGLAAEITAEVSIPVIGIGAGPDCDAQVLVVYDMLGITPGRRPKFSRDFLAGNEGGVAGAVAAYVAAVKGGSFPSDAESYE